jgi:hypothetical protein
LQKKVRELSGVSDWTYHACRDTTATWLQDPPAFRAPTVGWPLLGTLPALARLPDRDVELAFPSPSGGH